MENSVIPVIASTMLHTIAETVAPYTKERNSYGTTVILENSSVCQVHKDEKDSRGATVVLNTRYSNDDNTTVTGG
jgi:hypothetical protein